MEQFKYYAFISYKSEDKKLAKWLQGQIESYRLPAAIRKERSGLAKKIDVFRDKTDLRSGSLDELLKDELRNSKYLIVLCSPRSAKPSKEDWVGEEIRYFIDELHRDKYILPFIIEGEPYSNDPEKECYHPIIRERLPKMLGANINEAENEWGFFKKRKAVIRVIAAMLDVSFDSLWQRQRRRLIRKAITWVALIILFFSSIYFVWRTNQPFEVQISLSEIPPTAPNLKMKEAVIVIKLDNEQKSDTIKGIDGVAVFPNLPSKYRIKEIKLLLSSFGFYDIDTMVVLSEKLSLPIRRDADYFGKIVGTVRSRSTDKFVGGAIVKVGDSVATTDSEGRFEINISLPLQNKKYTAIVTYNDNESGEDVFPIQNNSDNINLLYVK